MYVQVYRKREARGVTCFWHVDIPGNLIMPHYYGTLCAPPAMEYQQQRNVIRLEFACLMQHRLCRCAPRRDIINIRSQASVHDTCTTGGTYLDMKLHLI